MALHLVLTRSSVKPLYLVSCSSESGECSTKTINLHPQFPKEIEARCSGDGLLCFFSYSDKTYVIWNASTDKYQLIPRNNSSNLPCACSLELCNRVADTKPSAHGLGFVPESHDYKFVMFLKTYHQPNDDGIPLRSFSEHVEVYSSKTNSWKEVPFPFHSLHLSPDFDTAATCVKGFLYWKTFKDVILSFDLSSDKFSTFHWPEECYVPGYTPGCYFPSGNVYLLEFDGSLCLVIKFIIGFTMNLRFWVYAASSTSASPWTRKFNLDVSLYELAHIPLWLGKKNNGGECLMLRGDVFSVYEYDYTTRELKKIDLRSPYVATNANFVKKKCGNGDTVDRISQLPDEMIVHVLSFLSLKEAASTSVLSTRWSDLWKHTPNLNFHDTHSMTEKGKVKYIDWVNDVLESHKALSLKEFIISFPICYSFHAPTADIKWLEFAFSRRVEVLELNFLGKTFDFLKNFLQKSTILESTNLRSVCLKCLKVSGSDVRLLLRSFPLLERLIIKSAVLTSDLEVCGTALKYLDIQYCEGGKSIKGYAPNLTSLKIASCPSLHKDDDHLNLAWATKQSADQPLLFPFISSQLTSLEFTLQYPPKGFFGNRFPLVPTLKELTVTYLGGHGIGPITSLIYAFPCLEAFEIKCVRRIRSPTEEEQDVVNNVENFCHSQYLRIFKFTWFDVDDVDHVELMSYILENCIALQKIILDIYGADLPSYIAAEEYAKRLQSKLPTHIQLIVSLNNRQLV